MYDLNIMAREYDPTTDTEENYTTLESEYGSEYTNKCFSLIYIFSVIFSSKLDMPWLKSLFDRTNDYEISKLIIDDVKVLTEAGEDVSDEHIGEIIAKIVKGNVNKTFANCQEVKIDMRNVKTSQ